LSLVECDNLHCGICRGIVTYQDFISTLDLPDCALLGQIFSYFDRSDQGSINFSQVHYPMHLLLNVSRLFDTV
jgi:lysophosphatidylcholine acyltransferase/lyso-PAF acetyltransferase